MLSFCYQALTPDHQTPGQSPSRQSRSTTLRQLIHTYALTKTRSDKGANST